MNIFRFSVLRNIFIVNYLLWVLATAIPSDEFYESLLGNYSNWNVSQHPYHPSELIRAFHNSPHVSNFKFKKSIDRFNITQDTNSLFNGYTRGVMFLPILLGVVGLMSIGVLLIIEAGYFDCIMKLGPREEKKKEHGHSKAEVHKINNISCKIE